MIRIGILGAGPMGRGNARGLAAHAERCTIAAVADPVEENAARIVEDHGAKAFGSCEDMLDSVDAVVISTPNMMHADQAVACATAGKHVFIEKPMALSTAEADRIVAAVDAVGVGSMIGFSVRFDGPQHTMIQKLRSGEMGALRSIWSRRMGFFGGRPGRKRVSWRSDPALSGGVLSELLVHEVDWLVYTAGRLPDTVFCRKLCREPDAPPAANDHLWMMFGFGPEVTGTIEGSMMGTIDEYYRGLMAEKGSLYTTDWGNGLKQQMAKGQCDQLESLEKFDKYEHFLDVIEQRTESVADVHHGRAIVSLSEKILESANTGEAVKVTGIEEVACVG